LSSSATVIAGCATSACSHRAIARILAPAGEAGVALRELAADGFAATASCAEVFATGAAGTVYLCQPFLVHAAQRHRARARASWPSRRSILAGPTTS
jgi:hypothetical protein